MIRKINYSEKCSINNIEYLSLVDTLCLSGALERFHRTRKQQGGTEKTRARCRDGTFRCHDSLMGVWMRLIQPPDYSED